MGFRHLCGFDFRVEASDFGDLCNENGMMGVDICSGIK
jgi:hypothetical protein